MFILLAGIFVIGLIIAGVFAVVSHHNGGDE